MDRDGDDARTAITTLVAAAEDGRLDGLCDRLRVRVLGVFGSAVTPGEHVGDVDIAAGYRGGEPRELELLDGLIALTGYDRIDLVDVDRADPVLRAEALSGLPLYQSGPGVFVTEQMAALAERRDTEWLRQLDVDALA